MSFPELPPGDLNEWLSELKPYQQKAMRELLKSSSEEDAAMHWVSAQGPSNIVGFGGVQDAKPFWDRFKVEFRRFLCDDQAYVEDKKALSGHATATKTLLISSLSAAIGASIGQAATLLAPAVTVMLFLAAKMGRNAFCAAGETEPKAG
jgi:hypothetical protein